MKIPDVTALNSPTRMRRLAAGAIDLGAAWLPLLVPLPFIAMEGLLLLIGKIMNVGIFDPVLGGDPLIFEAIGRMRGFTPFLAASMAWIALDVGVVIARNETIGMRVTGVRVVQEDGGAASRLAVARRELPRLSTAAVATMLAGGWLWFVPVGGAPYEPMTLVGLATPLVLFVGVAVHLLRLAMDAFGATRVRTGITQRDVRTGTRLVRSVE